jgi:hypothetical protein
MRSFATYIIINTYNYGDELKEDEMVCACRSYGGNVAHFADPVIHRRITFNRILREMCWDVIVWINLVKRQWEEEGGGLF